MATAKQLLLGNLDYSAWANQVLLEACGLLSRDALEHDLGDSHRTVLATLRHIFYTERVWLERLLADFMPPLLEVGDQRLFRDPDPEPGLPEVRQRWPQVWNGLRAWLDIIPEHELDHPLSTLCPDGRTFPMTRAEILLHSVNHSTLHRGQVVSMLRRLGIHPPNIDLFSFYFLRMNL
jgi:uncharacterized damage-inducible protein DinB